MDCKDYQNLIIKFLLENQIDESLQKNIQEHLLDCDNCTRYAEEIMLLLDFYAHKLEEKNIEVEVPNPQRIWHKVKNTIEKTDSIKYSKKNRTWYLSFGKVALVSLVVAFLSSALTVILFVSFVKPKEKFAVTSEPTFMEKVLGYVGLIETPQQERLRRIKEQQALVEYWNQRIQMRRHQWDQKLKEAFERNLNEIDQAVAEYEKLLQENPYDEISGEMLDSAMREKLELLQEFAQL